MRMQERFLRVLATMAILCGLLAGCSAKRLPDYSPLPAQQYSHKSSQNGLTVAIHPLTRKTEIEEYFGTNLLAHHTLPVLVVMENRNPELSFIIREQEIKLSNEQAENVDKGRATSVGSSGAAEAVGMTSAVLLSPSLIILAASMESQAAEIRRNLVMKQLQQVMISPGDAKSGFVYFRLPKRASSPDRWRLQVEVIDPTNKTTLTYNYVFHWKWRS